MADITRFGVSLPTELLEKFDDRIREMGYGNRSKALADLIRDSLVQDAWKSGKGEVVGIVTMVYDHHTSEVVNKLLGLQHDADVNIYSTMHIHLDHHSCLEILAMRGEPSEISEFADAVRAVRGVEHCGLVVTSNLK